MQNRTERFVKYSSGFITHNGRAFPRDEVIAQYVPVFMRITWRWDQGHSEYLRFDSLKSQARVFAAHDGLDPRLSATDLKDALIEQTGLFYPSPETHSVWRQYQRAFKLGLLVDQDSQKLLRPTDICRLLAADSNPGLVADDFFVLFANRFCLPFPGFTAFKVEDRILYPAAATIKLLLAKGLETPNFSLNAQDVLNFIEGNQLDGTEDIDTYSRLQPVHTSFVSNDEHRQVREFLSFLAQISWLYWEDNSVKIAATITESFQRQYFADLMPERTVAGLGRAEAYRVLTRIDGQIPIAASQEEDTDHITYFEGNRRAITHLRVERNRRLRKAVFAKLESPARCDMCKLIPTGVYPWVQAFFDIHHLLPLSSPVALSDGGTALTDLRPICPNCHRAVHEYYGIYLRLKRRKDFLNRSDAVVAYEEARSKIQNETDAAGRSS